MKTLLNDIEVVPAVPTVSAIHDAVLAFSKKKLKKAERLLVSKKVRHEELVLAGRQWLERRCSVVISEMASQHEEPDGIGWQKDKTILIECKVSRSDFLADRTKVSRMLVDSGMGYKRYYLVPVGLVEESQLPEGWGLLVWNGRYVKRVVESKEFIHRNVAAEMRLLISAIRRIGEFVPRGSGCAVWAYRYQTQKKAVLGTAQSLTEEKQDGTTL